MPDLTGAAEGDVRFLPKIYEKVALFGGVYNNHLALRRACEMAVARGCDGLFQLGDLGGFGPSPDKVFPILEQYKVHCLRGNYEESLIRRLEDCGCGYTHPRDNHYAQLSYDYTNRNLSEANRATLASFPGQIRFTLGRLTVHLCHGSPRRTNEFLWETTTSDAFLATMASSLGVEILCCTHTGLPWKRGFSPGRWIVNVGALGRPANDGQTNVWYAEVAWQSGAPVVELVPVEYDWKSLADEMRAECLPNEFIETIETGWWTTCLEILPGKERARGRY